MYSSREFSSSKNGYYRTTDGGRTWDIRSFDGDGWIYEACVDGNGNAWLGTAGKTIHYSSDYGEHFKALKIPLKKSPTTTGGKVDKMRGKSFRWFLLRIFYTFAI